jgi:hypothetical protein
MRAISNRIRRLERALVPPVQDEQETLAAVLDARRRRRLEATGRSFEDEPRKRWTGPPCWAVSLFDVLSGRYAHKASLPSS